MAQSAPRSPSKGEIMGSIPIGANLLLRLPLLFIIGQLVMACCCLYLAPFESPASLPSLFLLFSLMHVGMKNYLSLQANPMMVTGVKGAKPLQV